MAKNAQLQGTADFDWDALALDGYTLVQRSEMSDVYEQTLTSIDEKEVVEGTVVLVTKKEHMKLHNSKLYIGKPSTTKSSFVRWQSIGLARQYLYKAKTAVTVVSNLVRNTGDHKSTNETSRAEKI